MAILRATFTDLAPPLTSMGGWPQVRSLRPSRHRGRSPDGHRQFTRFAGDANSHALEVAERVDEK